MLLVEFQLRAGGTLFRFRAVADGRVGQLHPPGDGNHHAEEQGQQEGFNGEQPQVLDHRGQNHKGVGFSQNRRVIPHGNEGIEDNIHKQVHGEPSQNHPGHRDLRPVEEQGKQNASRHLHEHVGQEIHAPLGEEQIAREVRHAGGQGRHHRPEDHGAHGVDQRRADVDVQVRGQGNCRPLHGNPQGDHQGGDDQHLRVLQLLGGVVPIGS